jgi:hypothetical protein
MPTDMTVSREILAQLGGGRFVAMTGARQFVGDDDGLTFRLPATMTRGRASGMRITLAADDTYTLETFKVVRFEMRVLETCRGIYVDALRRTFTRMTGLDTSLCAAAA